MSIFRDVLSSSIKLAGRTLGEVKVSLTTFFRSTAVVPQRNQSAFFSISEAWSSEKDKDMLASACVMALLFVEQDISYLDLCFSILVRQETSAVLQSKEDICFSLGCYNEVLQIQWHKTMDLFCLCSRGSSSEINMFALKFLWAGPFLLFQLWWFQVLSGCVSLPPFSVPIFKCSFQCLCISIHLSSGKGTGRINEEGALLHYDLIISNHIFNDLISKQSPILTQQG